MRKTKEAAPDIFHERCADRGEKLLHVLADQNFLVLVKVGIAYVVTAFEAALKVVWEVHPREDTVLELSVE
jgi:hypothetical protein